MSRLITPFGNESSALNMSFGVFSRPVHVLKLSGSIAALTAYAVNKVTYTEPQRDSRVTRKYQLALPKKLRCHQSRETIINPTSVPAWV